MLFQISSSIELNILRNVAFVTINLLTLYFTTFQCIHQYHTASRKSGEDTTVQRGASLCHLPVHRQWCHLSTSDVTAWRAPRVHRWPMMPYQYQWRHCLASPSYSPSMMPSQYQWRHCLASPSCSPSMMSSQYQWRHCLASPSCSPLAFVFISPIRHAVNAKGKSESIGIMSSTRRIKDGKLEKRTAIREVRTVRNSESNTSQQWWVNCRGERRPEITML